MSNDQLHNTAGANLSVSNVSLDVAGVASAFSGGNAALGWSATGLNNGDTLTITTDGTYDFGVKSNPKPLFFWRADEGLTPNSTLGRKTAWDTAPIGELSNAIVASGSSQSVRLDHSVTDGAILGGVDFDSSEIYVFRRRYDDFGVDTNVMLRARYLKSSLTGFFSVGEIVTGETTGATGKILSVDDTGTTTGALYIGYEPGTSVADNVATPRGDLVAGDFFDAGEVMTTAGGSAINWENGGNASYTGNGILRDFNNKHFRLWGLTQEGQRDAYSTYIGQDTGTGITQARVYEEGTALSSAFYADNWDNPLRQKPYQWNEDEFVWKDNTGLDTDDGVLSWWENGIKGWEAERFNFRSASHTQPYRRVYQRQVSNGAKPLSFAYYDQLYIDDSLCRIIISDSPTLNLNSTTPVSHTTQPLPPSSWTTNQIKCSIVGSLTGKYYHVINSAGVRVCGGQI